MQIYVEIERARLTKRLAKIKEASGDVDEAADTLQEVAVVSIGWSLGHGLLEHLRFLSVGAGLSVVVLLTTQIVMMLPL